MGEPVKDRISRLGAKRAEIRGKVKSIRESTDVRNAEFRISRLKGQDEAITMKIKELRGIIGQGDV